MKPDRLTGVAIPKGSTFQMNLSTWIVLKVRQKYKHTAYNLDVLSTDTSIRENKELFSAGKKSLLLLMISQKGKSTRRSEQCMNVKCISWWRILMYCWVWNSRCTRRTDVPTYPRRRPIGEATSPTEIFCEKVDQFLNYEIVRLGAGFVQVS